jgi:hypothetical protein
MAAIGINRRPLDHHLQDRITVRLLANLESQSNECMELASNRGMLRSLL